MLGPAALPTYKTGTGLPLQAGGGHRQGGSAEGQSNKQKLNYTSHGRQEEGGGTKYWVFLNYTAMVYEILGC